MMMKIVTFIFILFAGFLKAQVSCNVQTSANDICPGDAVTLTYAFNNPTDFSVQFNGVDELIEINNNPALDFGTTNFTIEFWYYTFNANNNASLISKVNATGVGYSIGLFGGNLSCTLSDGGTPVVITDATPISANQWYHVAVVFNRSSDCTIYLDGVVSAGGQVSIATLGNISNSASIGVGGPAPAMSVALPYFNGAIDELRIWGRALPVGEILTRSTTHINPVAQNGLAGYWDMNDGTGTTVLDCGASGLSGNLINSASFTSNTPGLSWNFGVTWNTGDFGPSIIVLPADTTRYIATAGYCRYLCIDSIDVNVINCDSLNQDIELTNVWIPTSFTPNGDLKNDQFFVKGSYVYDYEIMIYNRFGNIVYHSKNMENAWDGTFEGERVKDDTYSYLIRYRDVDGVVFRKYGYIVLSY